MVFPINKPTYDQQFSLIKKESDLIEKLEATFKNNPKLLQGVDKVDDLVKLQYAALLDDKFPELRGLSPSTIAGMMDKIQTILPLKSQLDEALGEFSSMGALEDALVLAQHNFDYFYGLLQTTSTLAANTSQAIQDANITLQDAQHNLDIVIENGGTPEAIAAAQAAVAVVQSRIAELTTTLETQNNAILDWSAALNIVAPKRDALQERFDVAKGIDDSLSVLVAGNVVWQLYGSFSDSEKDLIAKLTDD